MTHALHFCHLNSVTLELTRQAVVKILIVKNEPKPGRLPASATDRGRPRRRAGAHGSRRPVQRAHGPVDLLVLYIMLPGRDGPTALQMADLSLDLLRRRATRGDLSVISQPRRSCCWSFSCAAAAKCRDAR